MVESNDALLDSLDRWKKRAISVFAFLSLIMVFVAELIFEAGTVAEVVKFFRSQRPATDIKSPEKPGIRNNKRKPAAFDDALTSTVSTDYRCTPSISTFD
jgi:hypothetical protein